MKVRTFVMGMMCLAVAVGAAPLKRHGARVMVRGKLEKERASSKNETEKNSKKTKKETQYYALKATVSNTGKQEATFDLEWFFLKRPLDGKGKKGDPVIAEKGKKAVTIGGMKRVIEPIKSKELSWTESKSSKSGNSKNSSSKKSINGAVYEGYVVVVRSEGEIIAKTASNRKYESAGWLAKFK